LVGLQRDHARGPDPCWWSTTPDKNSIQCADLFIAKEAHSTGEWIEMEDNWLGALVKNVVLVKLA